MRFGGRSHQVWLEPEGTYAAFNHQTCFYTVDKDHLEKKNKKSFETLQITYKK